VHKGGREGGTFFFLLFFFFFLRRSSSLSLLLLLLLLEEVLESESEPRRPPRPARRCSRSTRRRSRSMAWPWPPPPPPLRALPAGGDKGVRPCKEEGQGRVSGRESSAHRYSAVGLGLTVRCSAVVGLLTASPHDFPADALVLPSPGPPAPLGAVGVPVAALASEIDAIAWRKEA